MTLAPVNELDRGDQHWVLTEWGGRYLCDVIGIGRRWTVSFIYPDQSRLAGARLRVDGKDIALDEATWDTKYDAVIDVRKLLTAGLRRAA